jgi:hypothetical protein
MLGKRCFLFFLPVFSHHPLVTNPTLTSMSDTCKPTVDDIDAELEWEEWEAEVRKRLLVEKRYAGAQSGTGEGSGGGEGEEGRGRTAEAKGERKAKEEWRAKEEHKAEEAHLLKAEVARKEWEVMAKVEWLRKATEAKKTCQRQDPGAEGVDGSREEVEGQGRGEGQGQAWDEGCDTQGCVRFDKA